MLWRDMRGRTRRKSTNELQDLDPKGSPHLEEKLIGRNIDLDLLSLFPQDYARIMGGRGRESKASRSTMEERENRKPPAQGGTRGPFIGPPRKLAVAGHLPRSLRPWGPESLAPSLRP
jgi:hypothetical protein